MLARAVGVLLASVAVCAAAQQPSPSAPPQTAAPAVNQELPPAQIRVDVNEVIVPVTVTDDKNKFVADLDAKDFKIFDEGKSQQIRFFSRERAQPTVVGFLVDMSNATRLHWKTYQEAVKELVWNLLDSLNEQFPGGTKRFSAYLISYGNEAELLVNTTSDSEPIATKLDKMKPGGGAALYDAIYLACTKRSLIQGEPYVPRRVLLIVGDGHDNSSKKSLEEVIEIAQRNLVTIYAMSTVAYGFSSDGDANLLKLVQATGGRVVYPLQGLYSDVSGYLSTPSDEGNYAYKVGTGGYASEIAKGVFKAVAAIAGEVTTQYILRYVPSIEGDPNSKPYRNIRVEVALPNVKVRARQGYYPASP